MTEVRVVCRHGVVTTFVGPVDVRNPHLDDPVSRRHGVWIISTQHADRATNRDGVQRWHAPVECRKCGITAPAVNQRRYGPAVDWIVESDLPGITWVSRTVVEVPLRVWALKLGKFGESHDDR